MDYDHSGTFFSLISLSSNIHPQPKPNRSNRGSEVHHCFYRIIAIALKCVSSLLSASRLVAIALGCVNCGSSFLSASRVLHRSRMRSLRLFIAIGILELLPSLSNALFAAPHCYRRSRVVALLSNALFAAPHCYWRSRPVAIAPYAFAAPHCYRRSQAVAIALEYVHCGSSLLSAFSTCCYGSRMRLRLHVAISILEQLLSPLNAFATLRRSIGVLVAWENQQPNARSRSLTPHPAIHSWFNFYSWSWLLHLLANNLWVWTIGRNDLIDRAPLS